MESIKLNRRLFFDIKEYEKKIKQKKMPHFEIHKSAREKMAKKIE